ARSANQRSGAGRRRGDGSLSRDGTCNGDEAAYELRQVVDGSFEVVVLDDVVELAGLCQLLPGQGDPLADLAAGLGRTLPEPPLELVHRRRDEDRHRPGNLRLHALRALGLELEQGDLAVAANPRELREERAVAVPGHVLDVLQELARLELREELVRRQEPVVAAGELAGPLVARRRRNRHL